MISIANEGPTVVSTTYWATEHAARGLLYASVNAGAVRVLVPPATERLLDDLPPEGTRATIRWRDGRCTITLYDRPSDPYGIEIDERQTDRRPPASDRGRVVPLVWYVQDGTEGVREVRRDARVRIG